MLPIHIQIPPKKTNKQKKKYFNKIKNDYFFDFSKVRFQQNVNVNN